MSKIWSLSGIFLGSWGALGTLLDALGRPEAPKRGPGGVRRGPGGVPEGSPRGPGGVLEQSWGGLGRVPEVMKF